MDNIQDAVANDITSCPDGLVLWEEQGVCAPPAGLCEHPRELPTVDGSCVVIGPRACPKAWDPDADVDCEPGDLMPCEEGFVLTEDEVACIPHFDDDCGEDESPILGGGCQKVGPEWGEEGEPYLDDCSSGFLALPGGGCRLIGPRACPKLWDPEADVDCEVGEVLPCPDGWIEGEDGLYCEPVYDDCGPGERPLLGGGCHRVIPLAVDCPPGPFPDVPEGAGEVVYVLAGSPCTEDCGSPEVPYPSIQAAVDAVPQGGYVLVGAGVYGEGLLIDKPVHVIGVCAGVVELTGKTLVLASQKSKTLEAGIGVVDTHDVEIHHLRVISPVQGIAVVNVQEFTLGGIDVDGSHGTSLYVDHGSSGTAEGTWLHDTNTGSGQLGDGIGIWVGGGSETTVNASLVDSVEMAGVKVTDLDTELALSDTVIRHTRLNSTDDYGFGVYVQSDSKATLNGVLLEENRSNGLFAIEGGLITVEGGIIRGTKPDGEDNFGRGVRAKSESQVDISSCLIEGNTQMGVVAVNPGTEISLTITTIRDTIPTNDGKFGEGLVAQDGSLVNISGCLIEGNTEIGVFASDPGTEVSLTSTVIRDHEPDEQGLAGIGLAVLDGSRADISGCVVEGNTQTGVYVADPGTDVNLTNTTVRDTKPDGEGDFGNGVEGFYGSQVNISGCLIEGNTKTGVFAADPGTDVNLTHTVVRDTEPNLEGIFGGGVGAQDGSQVDISGCVIDGNTGIGVFATDAGTDVYLTNTVIRDSKPNEEGIFGTGVGVQYGSQVDVSGCMIEGNTGIGVFVTQSGADACLTNTIIRDTKPNDEFGRGVHAEVGGQVLVSGCLIERNTECGVVAFDPSTEVRLINTVVRDTKPNEVGVFGGGVGAQDGSRVDISGCLIDGNTDEGISAGYPGSEVSLTNTIVRDTKPNKEGRFGWGIDAQDGSRVDISGCLLEGNTEGGVVAFDPNTEVSLTSTIIRDTKPNEEDELGRGIGAQGGTLVEITGCLIEGNTDSGVAALEPDTEISLSNTIIRDTKLNPLGKYGVGLVALGGETEIHMSMFDGNRTAGIWSGNLGVVMSISDCAVLDTHFGGGEDTGVAGDGVLVVAGGHLDLHSSVVARNDRTGVYCADSTGTVSGSIITLNESYGLAVDSCETCVDYSDPGNLIIGNALDLPHNLAKQATTNPGELPVPESPDMGVFEVR